MSSSPARTAQSCTRRTRTRLAVLADANRIAQLGSQLPGAPPPRTRGRQRLRPALRLRSSRRAARLRASAARRAVRTLERSAAGAWKYRTSPAMLASVSCGQRGARARRMARPVQVREARQQPVAVDRRMPVVAAVERGVSSGADARRRRPAACARACWDTRGARSAGEVSEATGRGHIEVAARAGPRKPSQALPGAGAPCSLRVRRAPEEYGVMHVR